MANASDILTLLHNKHPVENFLNVNECKIGSTWFKSRCSRFDMWTMARSYTHPRFIGYEIKVSRSDFLNDTKWPDYLPYCTEFYFVSPPDIIQKEEVPEQAGLIVSSKNCKRLYTKKKAPVRKVEIPQSILLYILMSRSVICADMIGNKSKLERWKDKLRDLEDNRALGRKLSQLIAARVHREVSAIKARNLELETENKALSNVKDALDAMGTNLNEMVPFHGYVKKDRLSEALTGIPFDLVNFLKDAKGKLDVAVNVIEKFKKEP